MSIKVFMNREFGKFDRFLTSAIVWLALSAVCDIVIAVGLSHALVCFSLSWVHVHALNTEMNSTRARRVSLMSTARLIELYGVSAKDLPPTLCSNNAAPVTLETGSLTAITALADVWLFLVFPVRDFYFFRVMKFNTRLLRRGQQ
jgi:hypothetical protein